jgi:EpsD family peptidyl-prolyl cis-trans isomerase
MGAIAMKRGISLLVVGLMLASCGGKQADAPKGQVVATVDGQEITASELRLEVGDMPADPTAAAAAQKAALQSLVTRKLLVAEAKKRDLEKSPVAAMLRARAEEMALVQLLQNNIASGVPKISDDEVNDFVRSHPTTFAQRRLISIDQLLVPKIDPAVVKKMEPLKTMAEVEALLAASKVEFVRAASVMDTVNLAPEIATKINSLGGNEVFVVPTGAGVQVALVTGTRLEPIAGAEAQRIARVVLMQQRSGTQVRQALEQIVKAGQSKVKVNADYEAKPAAQPKPAAK